MDKRFEFAGVRASQGMLGLFDAVVTHVGVTIEKNHEKHLLFYGMDGGGLFDTVGAAYPQGMIIDAYAAPVVALFVNQTKSWWRLLFKVVAKPSVHGSWRMLFHLTKGEICFYMQAKTLPSGNGNFCSARIASDSHRTSRLEIVVTDKPCYD